ncbi:MAG: tetratricopeptide repeat protein, partial [Pirellulaceae bacterium]|nr:tetratricopeptide repeat protein [Pirellulaceae bacterium]
MSHDSSEAPGELPGSEFLVSPAMRRKLQQCYEHGTSLMSDDAYDYDYAHTMFVECVVHDPGNLVYVEAFLENLQRKYQNNKRGARMLSFGGKTAFKKALARQDWKEVLRSGPALLKTNPWDVQVLRGLAQACEAYHFNEAELRYLKNALDANPKDADVNRHCALSLARMGQFDQAIACWHRVEEAKRHDAEAPKMISALTIEKARARAGYGSDDIISSRATPAGSAAASTTASRRAAAAASAASAAPAKPATSPVPT